LEHVSFAELTEIYAALEGEARTRLLREGVEVAGQRSVRYAAIRYLGQDFALEVRADDAEACAQLAERFHAEHERVYGQADRSRPVELVTVRVEATGRSGPPPTEVANDERQGGRPASTREVWFADGGYQPTSVLDRRSLQPGEALTGPLVIEQADATALVEPGDRVEVLDDGTLLVSLEAAR
jgi:N-methylhydantoinase A